MGVSSPQHQLIRIIPELYCQSMEHNGQLALSSFMFENFIGAIYVSTLVRLASSYEYICSDIK